MTNRKFDWPEFLKRFKYQPKLTKKLENESSGKDFTQEIINEIVLWKVNRYAEVNNKTLEKINKISPDATELDEEFTLDILNDLLQEKGIRIAMASTILKFKNPAIYQIMDQRVHRFLFENANQNKILPERMPDSAESYITYLKILRRYCSENGIEFSDSDKILYQVDKEINKGKKIRY